MKTITVVGFIALCVLEIVLVDGEKVDCVDKEKMKEKIKEMREKGRALVKECREANKDDRNAMRQCIKDSFGKKDDMSLDDLIAKYMEYILPDKKEEVEQAGKECAAENENSENKYSDFMKCWSKRVSEFCNLPFGGRWGNGRSEDKK